MKNVNVHGYIYSDAAYHYDPLYLECAFISISYDDHDDIYGRSKD